MCDYDNILPPASWDLKYPIPQCVKPYLGCRIKFTFLSKTDYEDVPPKNFKAEPD